VIQEGKKLGLIKDEDITQGALPSEILMMFLGCIAVYALLFGMGYVIYGQYPEATLSTIIAVLASWTLYKTWIKKEKKYIG
nr:hypothetical protein [Saprospiraceae bacterium]